MLTELHTDSKSFLENAFIVGVYLYSITLNGSEEKCYKDALKFLRINYEANCANTILKAKRILSSLPPRYPVVGLEMDMYFDFYQNEKTDFNIACLGAFLGIKSIIGTKSYCKTNRAFIHARMFGNITSRDLNAKPTPAEEKYQIRWHMEKVLMELQTNWHLKLYSFHQRGMYVSFDLSINELALKSEQNKQTTKVKQLMEEKRRAMEIAKAQLTKPYLHG